VEAPKVEVPTAASPAVGEPTSPKAEGALAEAPATTNAGTATPTSDKTALEEKNDARRALERGKVTESIEAGERAVALDPQDGEAWLLLGAAYQEKGKLGDARRCYAACLKQGKRGPLGECQAMLR
jgi:Flp pilus assembly protein TadD